jgi:hypothetical protein
VAGQRFDPPWPFIPPPEFAPGHGTVLLTDQATGAVQTVGHDIGVVQPTSQAIGTVQPADHDRGAVQPSEQATGRVRPQ